MPKKLKNLFFTKDSLNTFADSIKKYYPEFDKAKFLKLIYDDTWDNLELKQKMRHTSICLHKTLPEDYIETLVILIKVAHEIKGFEAMSLPDFVEVYGMEHWEESLNALGHFTKYYSSEFAIRPFLDKNPELGMHYMNNWAEHEHENVRRFASEGCRPRLPWAMALPKFKKDPALILPILEKLKDDDSEFVRKSVANNLNDISKDNPEIVLDVCERWHGKSERTDWIVKHACRTLLKQGNTRAMRLFGFGDPEKLEIQNLKIDKTTLKIGESLIFSFELANFEKQECKVRLEYAMDFVKANGKHSRKIFQIIEKTYLPGKHVLKRKHSFVDMSTRKHYPGGHRITIIINGEEKADTLIMLKNI
ncbi:MAG: hypothetical protein B6D61_06775 [Bacteroidetes bacterium 4484_249]|nr:MAG: hypothetical protein B6D61_06775 [Bacteroidetes bacterium 4484_249]